MKEPNGKLKGDDGAGAGEIGAACDRELYCWNPGLVLLGCAEPAAAGGCEEVKLPLGVKEEEELDKVAVWWSWSWLGTPVPKNV